MEFGNDKVAIITGASRGIGAGLVEAYRKHGYRVIANSRTIIETAHPEVVTVAGDITDPDTAQRILTAAMTRFGRVDTCPVPGSGDVRDRRDRAHDGGQSAGH